MKTAVSIADGLFERLERLARRRGRSRSALVSAALAEYVARHEPDEVTEAMNRVCARLADARGDEFLRAAAQRVLHRSEW